MTAADVHLDPHNANLGTERGAALLAESLETCGVGRPVLVDASLTAIAGNQTLKAARAKKIPVQVVQTTGEELVVVRRTDLDLLTDQKARQLAYYDNRVLAVDLQWSGKQIQEDALAGVNLDVAFFPNELATFAQAQEEALDHASRDAARTLDGSHVATHGTMADASDDAPPEPAEEKVKRTRSPLIGAHPIDFDTPAQHERFYTFLRMLGDLYPTVLSVPERLARYLDEREGLAL